MYTREQLTATEERDNWPDWLRAAETAHALVSIREDGAVVWYGGYWIRGTWLGGTWVGGEWLGGTWHGGSWYGGDWIRGEWLGGQWFGGQWLGGTWHDGRFDGGQWHSGTWLGGQWRSGRWRGGEWKAAQDRMAAHALAVGIALAESSIGYVSSAFLPPHLAALCMRAEDGARLESSPGIPLHGLAQVAFETPPQQSLWQVEFRRSDVIDCDGQCVRVARGIVRRMAHPLA